MPINSLSTDVWSASDQTYQIITNPLTYDAAVSAAEALGGSLAIITSKEEDEHIYGLLSSSSITSTANDGGGAKYAWIGLSDSITEGTWKWLDGTTLSYSNWGSGNDNGSAFVSEPDDYDGQDYVAIGLENWPVGGGTFSFGSVSQWNDVSGDNNLSYVVEIPNAPVVNNAPVANNDPAITTNEDTVYDNINVIDNDTDQDEDTLTVTSASALHGSVDINTDYTLNYTPNSDYYGSDTITYTLSDGALTNTATVGVSVVEIPITNPGDTTPPNTASVITGTTSDDILNGTTDNDEISTGLGADVVYALAGEDDITLTADSTWGTGYFAKNVSNHSSVGTQEKISLEGLNRFNDVIDGGDDVDMLNLTSGNDAFFIDDVYSEHHSSLTLSSTTQGIDSTARIVNLEKINAGEGDDIVDLTSDNFVLATTGVRINGEAGNDTLWGSNGSDTINGGTGNDSLFGGTGSDILIGSTGSDTFQFSATSSDILIGGTGSDTSQFSTISGSDIILDFDVSEDTIELYYRAQDNHTNTNLNLTSGILTWDVDNTSNDVSINLSATTTSSDLNDVDSLITFVEIV